MRRLSAAESHMLPRCGRNCHFDHNRSRAAPSCAAPHLLWLHEVCWRRQGDAGHYSEWGEGEEGREMG